MLVLTDGDVLAVKEARGLQQVIDVNEEAFKYKDEEVAVPPRLILPHPNKACSLYKPCAIHGSGEPALLIPSLIGKPLVTSQL